MRFCFHWCILSGQNSKFLVPLPWQPRKKKKDKPPITISKIKPFIQTFFMIFFFPVLNKHFKLLNFAENENTLI